MFDSNSGQMKPVGAIEIAGEGLGDVALPGRTAAMEEYPQPSKIRGLSEEMDVRDARFVNYKVAGRVRLDAADANVEIGPFVPDVTFSGPPPVAR